MPESGPCQQCNQGTENSWYEVIKNGDGFSDMLMQGDLVPRCPCALPPAEITSDSEDVTVKVIRYNAVIMSQTCDIVQNKISFVLVSPYWTLEEFEQLSPHFKSENNKEALRRGYQHGFILLDKCNIEGFENDYYVIDCRYAFSVPLTTLKRRIGELENRLRLKPPYREYASYHFGNFFGRVGLPKEIAKFNARFKLDHCDECEHNSDNSFKHTINFH